MAIEDHPQFLEWASALDSLKDAKDTLQAVGTMRGSERMLEAARADLQFAQANYDRVSREING